MIGTQLSERERLARLEGRIGITKEEEKADADKAERERREAVYNSQLCGRIAAVQQMKGRLFELANLRDLEKLGQEIERSLKATLPYEEGDERRMKKHNRTKAMVAVLPDVIREGAAVRKAAQRALEALGAL
jgi:hypothetical protein